MQTDGVVAPHPPITRALRMVIQAVEAAGYEVRFIPETFRSC